MHDYNYGHLWWPGQIAGRQAYVALGYGGQYILIFPNLDMIEVAFSNTSVFRDDADRQERGVLHLVARYLVAAAG